MPQYAYRAVDTKGKVNKGITQAANENDLFARLHQQGLSLIDCKASDTSRFTIFQNKIQLPEQVLLCRHLVMLTKAGVPVHIAMEDILPSLPSTLCHKMQEILENVIGGRSLSSEFASSNMGFDPLFSLLLQAGEKTGRINEALNFLHESLKWKMEYQEKMKRALSYPVVQILLAAVAVTVLMAVAVPQIEQLLKAIGEELPLYSVILLWGMKLLGFGIVLLASTIILSAVLSPLLKMHQDVAEFLDRSFLSLPVLGALFTKIELAQITHVLAAMLGSGITLMDSLKLLSGLTRNRAMATALTSVYEQVGGGQSLSKVLTINGLIPAYTLRILRIGEDSGKMADSLRHVSDVYQEESQTALDELIKISTMFITLVVGLTLVLMVVGVMVPLYRGISHIGAA